MCYSAGASFVGGAVISAIGVATVKEVKKPSQLAFASIPLLFGLQQITEGFLWLALTDPGYAHLERAGTYGFLLMARIIWPTMLPLSVMLMEEGGGNRRLQFILLGMGLSVSVYYTYCLAVPECRSEHCRAPYSIHQRLPGIAGRAGLHRVLHCGDHAPLHLEEHTDATPGRADVPVVPGHSGTVLPVPDVGLVFLCGDHQRCRVLDPEGTRETLDPSPVPEG